MRISDWSSDVCSSDLGGHGPSDRRARQTEHSKRGRSTRIGISGPPQIAFHLVPVAAARMEKGEAALFGGQVSVRGRAADAAQPPRPTAFRLTPARAREIGRACWRAARRPYG